MPDHILERRVWLPRPRPEVFEFFADPGNLSLIQPPWARPRWLAPPPPRLVAGAVLDFRVPRLPMAWRVMIREFDPPYRFVDVQLRGPFARWEHRHRFVEGAHSEPGGTPGIRVEGGANDRPAGAPGTWVEDRVTYRFPAGALGRLAHALGGGRRLRGLFDYRDQRLRERFRGG
ncbi:MAG TPA: SRPBCC family protein [Methylomirabilota bacterium]|jgi:ligand-binding SRPBCC domain-containing protein|nr:SRPBCC family protein [Methylomirabilota bacterium]